MKAGRRISLALALSLILFLPVAYADNTITLTSPNAQTNGRFGQSVAVNEGDPIVVVGAPDESAGTPAEPLAGHAYVLDTTIGLITTLTSPTPELAGEFGFSVAVSGTTVVVGAPLESAGTPAQMVAGNAYVFDATDGSLITTLTSPNTQTDGVFGLSVAVSGTTVVVGAHLESAGTPAQLAAGHAYVFDASTGFLTTTLTSPNAQTNGEFGNSVAVGGTTVVVGAPGEIVGLLTSAGHAYSFDASTGFLTTTLTSPNAQNNGRFGLSVAVTESDPIVVVGAPRESGGGSSGAGHAYVFF